ncbi:MAG: hypothetical protein ACLGPL_06690 [Acidobacteriota bacterium]
METIHKELTVSVLKKVAALAVVALLMAFGVAESKERGRGMQEGMISGLVGDVRIPPATSDYFNGLYRRNKPEIRQLIDDNPTMVWESLNLVLEALPALKAVGQNGGVLRLSSRLYQKTDRLFAQYEALASPKLSSDMGKARRYIESRVKENRNGLVAVDLN